MLTEREIKILKHLQKNQERFVTTNELAEKIDVSIRTIKSDLKNIRSSFEDETTITIKTVRSIGIVLECTNYNRLNQIIEENIEKNSLSLNNPNIRMNQLLLELIDNKLSKVEIQHRFNVSESTVNNDLKNIKNILDKYNLKLIIDKNNKLEISGNEQHKRNLISQYKNTYDLNRNNIFFNIENIILKVLIDEEYNVTEQIFNNILVHIQLSIDRIIDGKVITEYNKLSKKWNRQVAIARQILEELGRAFSFEVYEGEIINLAILLAGKGDFNNQNYISDDISDFIDNALNEIDKAFNVSLSNQIENKLNLSLHVIPLLERLKHNVQLPDQHNDFIRQSFPLAFDIGAYFSMKMNKIFKVSVTENELSYLAIHFNKFLIESNESWGKKEILIISNIRRSESILLKQRLLTWFREEINKVEVANYSEVKEINLDNFDIVFSTDENEFTSQYAPIIIRKFPKDSDYLNLKLAIDGFKGKDDILSLFKEEFFLIDQIKTKEDVFNKYTEIIAPHLGESSSLLMESVKIREEMSNTYFSNKIAFPHPAIPFSIGSFVSVIIFKEPIIWNEDLDKVKVSMLVAIEKNNAKSFQLWNYLSGLTKDEMFISRLNDVNSYDDFMEVIELSIKYN